MLRRPRPTTAVAAACVLLASCSDGGTGSASEDEAAITSASVALEDGHSIVGRLVIDTDDESLPEVRVTGPGAEFTIPVEAAASHHELPVVGLRAEQTYDIEVRVGDDEERLELRTEPLPEELPDFDVVVSEPDRMSAGVTLFNLLDTTGLTNPEAVDASADPQDGTLVAVDAEGEIVWYHQTPSPLGDARQLDDGTILHEYNDTGTRVIDLFGNTLEEWAGNIVRDALPTDPYGRQIVDDDAIPVDTDSMHHEVTPLPNGNFVTLSTEVREWDGFTEPQCDDADTFDGSYRLISDVVTEFTPEGEVVAEYPLADHFDPVANPETDGNICGLPLDNVVPNWFYRGQGMSDVRDWTHANAVVPDPSGDAFTVSIRHLDAVVNIDRDTGEMLWRLGPGGDFEMIGDGDFQYHQHAPEWQDDGTLLLYDNGNGRPGTATEIGDGLPPAYSRAVQYRLDTSGPEGSWTVEQVWEHVSEIDGEPVFSPVICDADRMANGNVLITDGGLAVFEDKAITAQIVEVVPDDDGEGGTPVFTLQIAEDRPLAIYRAERLPSLYGPATV